MIVGESYRAGLSADQPLIAARRVAADTQIACSLSTISATASNCGIGPNGSPRKSVSVPARITRTPRFASDCRELDDRRVEKLRLVDRHDLRVGCTSRAICSGVSIGTASTVRPSWLETLVDPRVALVQVRLEHLDSAFAR